jgi:phospholipase C
MSTLPHIKTVVMLMLENRSLDMMLGWLHRDGLAVNLIPSDSHPPHFDGIPADAVNYRSSWPGEPKQAWRPTVGFAFLGDQQWRAPRWDPNEGMGNVRIQMYGDQDGIIGDRAWGDEAPMRGFAWDFPAMNPTAIGEVMGGYTEAEIPVLYGLAKHFAVSDRWFSPVPTETYPNRAFSLCGTSGGVENDLPIDQIFEQDTIFNGLCHQHVGPNSAKEWAIYWQTNENAIGRKPGQHGLTETRFSGVQRALVDSAGKGSVRPFDSLLEALRAGEDIPEFCYIEPWWGGGIGFPNGDDFVGFQGNDYYAPGWIGPAEYDLNELYEALIHSKQWPDMLFVITFDEHGGCWDHVPPPAAANPDGINGASGFGFDRMGPRVPAILVSPYVEPRTVFRPPSSSVAAFDHTSIIKTVLRWAGTDESFITGMGKRVAEAPMFDSALNAERSTVDPPHFTVPDQYRTQGGKKGYHHLPKWAEGLSIDDHRIALSAASQTEGGLTVDGYLSALEQRASTRREQQQE